MAEPEGAPERPRVAGLDVLRQHWPALLAIGVMAYIYLDQRSAMEDLRVRVAVLEARGAAEEPPPPPELPFAPPPVDPATTQAAAGECSGILTGEQIQSVLASRGPEVFACAAQRRRVDPGLTGTVEMGVRIDDVGQVVDIEYQSPIRDAELEPCIRESVSEWVFPPPSGGCARIRLPFYFAPPDQGPQ